MKRLQIRFQNFSANPPIFVYQMGKVGSYTVYTSLQNANLPNPIYHVHFLSHEGIKSVEEYFRSINFSTEHFEVSKILRRKIDRTQGGHWKIITLLRDPISRDISDLFENLEHFYLHLLDQNGNVKQNEAIEFLQKMFANYDELTDYTCTWFDRELKSAFNIDVYTYPFDQESGFTIIRERNIELLILRLEDLTRNFRTAVTELLHLETPISIVKSNIGKEKKYSSAYKYVLENIVIPESVCRKIYSSRYAKHFYGEHIRNSFIQRWSKKHDNCDAKTMKGGPDDSGQ